MLNDGLVLTPSLETVSEVSFAAPLTHWPMMSRLWSWLTLHTDEPRLSCPRLTGRVTQAPCSALHLMQLLPAVFIPPHIMLPDCTWPYLLSGSGGSSQVLLSKGVNSSALWSAPQPPVIRMAAEMEIVLLIYAAPVLCSFQVN